MASLIASGPYQATMAKNEYVEMDDNISDFLKTCWHERLEMKYASMAGLSSSIQCTRKGVFW